MIKIKCRNGRSILLFFLLPFPFEPVFIENCDLFSGNYIVAGKVFTSPAKFYSFSGYAVKSETVALQVLPSAASAFAPSK